jgi:hypothetical protein
MPIPAKFARTYGKLRCGRPAAKFVGPSVGKREPTFHLSLTQVLEGSRQLGARQARRGSVLYQPA